MGGQGERILLTEKERQKRKNEKVYIGWFSIHPELQGKGIDKQGVWTRMLPAHRLMHNVA